MKTIIIHTGRSVESITRKELHPVNSVLHAREIFNFAINSHTLISQTNSPDFVSAMRVLAETHNIPIEYYIDGVRGDIEKVFEDFNRAFDLINEISQK